MTSADRKALIGIVIVAHGGLAREYLNAVEYLFGHQEGIRAVSIERGYDPREFALVWRLAQYDRRCLQLLRHRYQRPDRTQPGAAGRQQFDFLPLQSGRTTLTFVAQPPLVATVAHQQLVTVTIK